MVGQCSRFECQLYPKGQGLLNGNETIAVLAKTLDFPRQTFKSPRIDEKPIRLVRPATAAARSVMGRASLLGFMRATRSVETWTPYAR